ncbi:hypothetical protein PVAND_011948 [Polypedilum vanderplanki]|uniref:glutathione transferase n=1 Tax=Polypedilum vanderplanki TaxID=319348 RepID=A0A9J6CKY0_POLVA|nr:hypothetical protein PVAND_011948 [Polypedilum vanderplanki]
MLMYSYTKSFFVSLNSTSKEDRSKMSKTPIYYYHLMSPPSRAGLMIIKELDLNIKLQEIDLLNSENFSEEFTKINPSQTVPSLVDDDFIVCDSHAICLYLIEKYAKNDKLYPKDDIALRTKINDRLFFDASFLFPRGYNIMIPVLMQGQSFIPEENINQFYRAFKVVESFLENSKWIASNDQMTLADIAIFAWMECYTQLFTIEDYPKLTAWLNEMRKLSYYEEANKKGAKLQVETFQRVLENNKKKILNESV